MSTQPHDAESGAAADIADVVTAPVEPLSKDDTFHLLQNERRRMALAYLNQQTGTVEMRDVAEQVAAWENDTTVQQLHSDERQRVYIALYQTHLPKLDDSGVISYNQSRGLIEMTSHVADLCEYIDLPQVDDAPSSSAAQTADATDADAAQPAYDLEWSDYYLGLSGVSTLALLASAAGFIPATIIPQFAIVVLVVAAFTLSAAGQAFLARTA
ncbi:hypothetical protein ACFQH3_01865 [Haladaptatus sp. GCM10025707]|uniref:DUF7344 domain-containing protein n=1 Tax=unclassified Haladaptatus TaxID=2622732 RepID=UPI0023E8A4D5|nr:MULTISPECIES: hypothetical protein [unclassified Haladaptatus]